MLFKLPRLVFLEGFRVWLLSFVFLCVGLSGLSGQALPEVEPDIFSYKGSLLPNAFIQHAAIRSDGRYLFFSESGSSGFKALDLLDTVTVSEELVNVGAPVMGLFMVGNFRLAVATTVGVRYFNVRHPFKVEEEEARKYERPTDTQTSPVEACAGADGSIYFFEVASAERFEDHFIRRVRDQDSLTNRETKIFWAGIFGDWRAFAVPLKLFCAKDSLIVVADDDREVNDPQGQPLSYLFSSVNRESMAGTQARIQIPDALDLGLLKRVNFLRDWFIQDFVLDSSRENLVVLFNSEEDGSKENFEYSQALRLSQNLNLRVNVSMGADGRLIAPHRSGDQSFLSFFMGKNYFDEVTTSNPFQILTLGVSQLVRPLPSGVFGVDEDRGRFPSAFGMNTRLGSEWLQTPSDHYVYGLVENQGLVRLSSAPGLSFAEPPPLVDLTEGDKMKFVLLSDRDVSYEIRFKDSVDKDGSAEGLIYSRGRRVAEGQLLKGESREFEFSASDLRLARVKRRGRMGLMIFARALGAAEASPRARLGVPFEYTPPPEGVEGFRLGFGSRSIHSFFRPRFDSGDLRSYLLHFSYDRADLDVLPANMAELEGFRRQVGDKLESPLVVSAERFSGRAAIAAVENGRELCVRVQVVNERNQLSEENPPAQCATPLPTRSLPMAFGRASGCQLRLR